MLLSLKPLRRKRLQKNERVQRHSKFLQAKFVSIENKQDSGENFQAVLLIFAMQYRRNVVS